MIELRPHTMAHGGEAVAHRDGKAHFVAGALPGEVVEARVVEDRGSWARAELLTIIEPSPARRDPPCPHAGECGGCHWQFAEEQSQRDWKGETVASQLEHLGGLVAPTVHPTAAPGTPLAYRNRMDFHVVDGRPALMRTRSNDPLCLDTCLLLEPLLLPLFERLGDLRGAKRVTLRCGSHTHDTLALVEGEVPAEASSWDVSVLRRVGNRIEPVVGDPKLRETVCDVLFTLSPTGFFQNNTAGADELVRLVREAADIGSHETLLDGYCGVGLFGATVGQQAGRVLGIDSLRSATDLARQNLRQAGVAARIITGSFSRDIARLEGSWDVAIVDPPRKGLGKRGVEAVVSARPRRVVYVACDPASLARDTRTLAAHGYVYKEATPVDMFPQTYHVEVVATFDRQSVGRE